MPWLEKSLHIGTVDKVVKLEPISGHLVMVNLSINFYITFRFDGVGKLSGPTIPLNVIVL